MSTSAAPPPSVQVSPLTRAAAEHAPCSARRVAKMAHAEEEAVSVTRLSIDRGGLAHSPSVAKFEAQGMRITLKVRERRS